MKRWLFEYDTGNQYGPCSEENWKKFQLALERGRPFFLYPYFGYELRMTANEVPDGVVQVRGVPKEKAPG